MLHNRVSEYRFNSSPPEDLPLSVRSCGSYTLTEDSPIDRPKAKWFSQLFWSQHGCGEFELEGRWTRVEGQALFFLLPGEVHHIRCASEHWTYHWLTMDHPESARMLHAYGISKRLALMADCPDELFRELRLKLKEGTLASDAQAAHLAHAILLETRAMRKTTSTHPKSWVEQCRQRIDSEYANSELNVTTIAEEFGIHRTTLFRAFRQHYAMLPSQYLQSRRLHHAMELLKQGGLSVKEVSQQVGFLDPNYMARLMKKVTGHTPNEFRRGDHL